MRGARPGALRLVVRDGIAEGKTVNEFSNHIEQVRASVHTELFDQFDPESQIAGKIWDPATGYGVLHRMHEVVVRIATTHVQDMGQYRWLYHLRRLPEGVFLRESPGGAGYDRMVAEAISGLSPPVGGPTTSPSNVLTFSWDHDSATRVMRLCFYAQWASFFSRAMRRAAKGQSFASYPGGFPERVPDSTLDEMITIFDERTSRDSGGPFAPGNEPVTFWDFNGEPTLHPFPIVHATKANEFGVKQAIYWRGAAGNGEWWLAPGNYGTHWGTFEHLRSLLTTRAAPVDTWWEPELPHLLTMLYAIGDALWFEDGPAGRNIPIFGYTTMPRGVVIKLIDRILLHHGTEIAEFFGKIGVPKDGESVVSTLEHLKPSIHPLKPGPILRGWGDGLAIDLATATERLSRISTLTPGAAPALFNTRGEQFELDVQAAIDRSGWAPSAKAPTRGLTLRLAGRDFTNLDAIAESEGTLILLSCKSYPHTYGIFAGEHNAIREQRKKVEADVAHWRQKVADIGRVRSFDNFEFGNWREILGAVVTPNVVYIADPRCLEIAATAANGEPLRWSSSMAEVLRFIGYD